MGDDVSVARMAKKLPPPNRRGSPEAIAKRRAGRAFNDLYDTPAAGGQLDGRTAKRRERLLQELETGKARGSGRALKPLDVLMRVSELLTLGEPLAAIRKACKPRSAPPLGPSVVEAVTELHLAYGFQPEAYRFVGVDDDVLRAAGVLPQAPRSERPRAATSRARTSRPPPR
jgi:hypothetical protein